MEHRYSLTHDYLIKITLHNLCRQNGDEHVEGFWKLDCWPLANIFYYS
jgi:hypothetical protein